MQVRFLGLRPYADIWHEMQTFTETRNNHSEDELWLVEHPPVYTQGLAGKEEHLLNPGDIEVIRIDRGGQITYHGPGQVVMYLLLDLKRRDMSVRRLVSVIEQSVVELLNDFDIKAAARLDAPGVYTENGAKIASLGLKVRKGCTYHGLALNVDMDLTPFLGINPCGLVGMKMTQISDFVQDIDKNKVAMRLAAIFSHHWQTD